MQINWTSIEPTEKWLQLSFFWLHLPNFSEDSSPKISRIKNEDVLVLLWFCCISMKSHLGVTNISTFSQKIRAQKIHIFTHKKKNSKFSPAQISKHHKDECKSYIYGLMTANKWRIRGGGLVKRVAGEFPNEIRHFTGGWGACGAYQGWKSVTLFSYSIPHLRWYWGLGESVRAFNKLNFGPRKGDEQHCAPNADYPPARLSLAKCGALVQPIGCLCKSRYFASFTPPRATLLRKLG